MTDAAQTESRRPQARERARELRARGRHGLFGRAFDQILKQLRIFNREINRTGRRAELVARDAAEAAEAAKLAKSASNRAKRAAKAAQTGAVAQIGDS